MLFLLFFFLSTLLFTHSTVPSTSTTIQNIVVWPYPSSYHDTPGSTKFVKLSSSADLTFTLFDEKTSSFIPISSDSFFVDLVRRYVDYLFGEGDGEGEGDQEEVIFQFGVGDISQRELFLGVEEKYSLEVPVPVDGSKEVKVTMNCTTIFGCVRGIESFVQLVSKEDHTIGNLPILIEDSPRYAWRGLLLDTSRHYFQIDTIKSILEGMAINKLNTFHWHLVDAQSFPLVVPKFPLLSEKGAYDPKRAIYSQAEIQDIQQFAYLRGIRLVPEIDVPGHAASWGQGYPSVVASCPSFESNINNIPLNPVGAMTTEIVEGVLESIKDTFPDTYVHLGGDELVYACWDEDPEIFDFMERHNLTGPDLEGYFMAPVIEKLELMKKVQVAWQERALSKSRFPISKKNTVVEVWKQVEDIMTVAEMGYEKIINSAGWYLDRMMPDFPSYHWLWLDTWIDMWTLEIDDFIPKGYAGVMGGEACMWSEQVNDYSVHPRIWPRAAAVAERLWSPKWVNLESTVDLQQKEQRRIVGDNLDTTQARLIRHTCRNMIQRGIQATPLRPDYCPTDKLWTSCSRD